MNRDDILLTLHTLTKGRAFLPLHYLGRKFYQGPLRYFVKRKLRAVYKTHSFDLVVRHSTANGNGFNLFSSDLDFTMVMDQPFSLRDADEFRVHYYRLKKKLPMLGEIEIFTQAEWSALQRIRDQYPELVQLLRDLKKIRWMEWKLEKPSHPYHVIKAKRAIFRILKKYRSTVRDIAEISEIGNHRFLGERFAQYFESIVPASEAIKAVRLEPPRAFSLYSRELHVTVGHGESPKPTLNLPTDVALCLLSIYPSHEDDDPAVLKFLNLLRETPQIKPLYLSFLKHDLFHANASPRVHVQFRDTSWKWTESLMRQYKAAVSDSESIKTLDELNYHPSNENGLIEMLCPASPERKVGIL